MSFDALTGGIEFGGLRTKNDIKILICYILANMKVPMSPDNIVYILQENGLANYFEIVDAFSDLVSNKNIVCSEKNKDEFIVTESGQLIAKQLESLVPLSIRDRAVAAAVGLISKIKREAENTVKIEKIEKGYIVDCHISDGKMDLMNIKLYVPDMMQANMVKSNFHKEPELVYNCLLSLLTGNKKTIIEEIQNTEKEESGY